MKKIAIVATGLSLSFATAAFADTKIGVVDLNKVLRADPHVAAAQAQLKKQFEPKNQALLAEQKSFQRQVEQYNKDQTNGKLKDADLKKAQQNLMSEENKIQEDRNNFQRELANAQNQSMQNILKKVETAVQKIAAEQKIDLVLTKASTAFSKPELEITDKVITEIKK